MRTQLLPFEDLFRPILQDARKRLQAESASTYRLLSIQAHASLEASLLKSLCGIAFLILESEFSLFRFKREPPFFLAENEERETTHHYHAFINKMRRTGAFRRNYVVLDPLLDGVTKAWLHSTTEFLGCLDSDLPEIEGTFNGSRPLGKVIALEADLSEKHDGARSVIALEFGSRRKLIYKPRNLGMEGFYFWFLEWINGHGLNLPFKTVRVLNKSTHGWMEYVKRTPCKSRRAACRYYVRAGMLQCLLTLLRGADCHMENLVAAGEDPVFVDLECLFQPVLPKSVDPEAGRSRTFRVLHDLLAPGLLPHYDEAVRDMAYDTSALGGVLEQRTAYRIPRWEHINSDKMSLSFVGATIRLHSNVAEMNRVRLRFRDYLGEFFEGYDYMYRFLMRCRAILPLKVARHQQLRFIWRDTREYVNVLSQSLQPRNLKDHEIRRKAILRQIGASFRDRRGRVERLYLAELEAINRLDIPRFVTRADSTDLRVGSNQVIRNFFFKSGYAEAVEQLEKLSYQDLEQKKRLLRMLASSAN